MTSSISSSRSSAGTESDEDEEDEDEPDELELYGRYKAKVDLSILDRLTGRSPDRADALVWAVSSLTFGAKGDDMGFLAWRDAGLNPYGNSVIVNAKFLEANRPLVDKFVKVTQRAFAACGTAIGRRVPKARLRPPRLRTCNRSSPYNLRNFLRFITIPCRSSMMWMRR